jgi:hypothetical protein
MLLFHGLSDDPKGDYNYVVSEGDSSAWSIIREKMNSFSAVQPPSVQHLFNIVCQMTLSDPTTRPSASSLLKHAIFGSNPIQKQPDRTSSGKSFLGQQENQQNNKDKPPRPVSLNN